MRGEITAGSPSFVKPDTNPANALVRAAAGSGGVLHMPVEINGRIFGLVPSH